MGERITVKHEFPQSEGLQPAVRRFFDTSGADAEVQDLRSFLQTNLGRDWFVCKVACTDQEELDIEVTESQDDGPRMQFTAEDEEGDRWFYHVHCTVADSFPSKSPAPPHSPSLRKRSRQQEGEQEGDGDVDDDSAAASRACLRA